MLGWALAFCVVALIAALFGFAGAATGAASLAKLLFVGFLVLAALTLVVHLVRSERTI